MKFWECFQHLYLILQLFVTQNAPIRLCRRKIPEVSCLLIKWLQENFQSVCLLDRVWMTESLGPRSKISAWVSKCDTMDSSRAFYNSNQSEEWTHIFSSSICLAHAGKNKFNAFEIKFFFQPSLSLSLSSSLSALLL